MDENDTHANNQDDKMMGGLPSRDAPSWSTPSEGILLFLRGATAATAWRVALVVGALLSAVNQGNIVVDGAATTATWVRIAFNFLVPYVVASIGFLSACREATDLSEE